MEGSSRTGFEYVIEKEDEKKRVSFGSRTDREVLPRKGPSLTSFMLRSGATIGSAPDTYYYEGVNSFYTPGKQQNKGKMGTIGRCTRWPTDKSYQPPPRPQVSARRAKSAPAPFNVSTPQRPEERNNLNPGPGTYNPSSKKLHMRFYHSFGGPRTLIPAVEIKCVPFNEDTCSICNAGCSEQGDYWHKDNRIYLCRACLEKQHCTHTRYSSKQLTGFKPIRDCFFAHHHELYKNSIKLMSARQIRKKVYKEAYFGQYFSNISDKKFT